jgi:predicted enzyme related to lactoylglutathione lyase
MHKSLSFRTATLLGATRYRVLLLCVALALTTVSTAGVATSSELSVPGITSSPTKQIRPGKIVWADLLTSDVNRAADFYRDAFGWEIVPSQDSGYLTARVDGEPVATIAAYEEDQTGQEALWLLSVSVADVDKTATRLLSSGGQVIERAFELRGRGRLAVVEDPQGAVLMILRATDGDPVDGGKAVENTWVWAELWTENPVDAVAFYEQVFDYRAVLTKGDSGDNHYVLGRDQMARASIVKTPLPNVESNWLPYLLVDDIITTIEKVRKAGGSVLLEPQRDDRNSDIAIVADPTRGVFALQQRPGGVQ